MPVKLKQIPLAGLDAAIQQAVAKINVDQSLKLKPGPIINGIIFTEDALGALKPATLAASITKSIPVPSDVVLKPQTTLLPDKRILVGYILKQQAGLNPK